MTNPVFVGEAPAEDPIFASPGLFYDQYLSVVFARVLNLPDSFRWCPEWRQHLEAAQVVEALWRAWEDCYLDPKRGLAYWFVQYAYPLIDRLSAGQGTFDGCEYDRHNPDTTRLPGVIEPG